MPQRRFFMQIKMDDPKFSCEVDVDGIAQEILQWLITNVEDYIDNNETVFPIYFPIDKNLEQNKEMHKTNAFGGDFLKIIDSDLSYAQQKKILDKLDEVVANIKNSISNDKENMEKLYKRMIWYYEMVGFHSVTGPIIQELEGYVKINSVAFEAIGMDVTVTQRYQKLQKDGTLTDSNKPSEVIKKEHIPEGFTVEIEIKKWAKVSTTSLL